MPITPGGWWVPQLFGKQWDQFNIRNCAALSSGPSLSGKTIGNLHAICRHLYDTNGARFAMFSKTLKTAKVAGTWEDMNKIIVPEWVQADIGFEYTTITRQGNPGPKIDGTTRTPFFGIRNRHGTESCCYLFSLDVENEIEDKIKEMRFSGVYFSELDKFKDRKVLSVTLGRLRMPHLKFADHIWLADTNPSEDREKSWIYEVWYLERTMSYSDYVSYCERNNRVAMPKEAFLIFQSRLQLIEMFPEDNPHLEPEKLAELKAQYSYDPELYDRYVLGKWTGGFGTKAYHFKGSLKPDIHILGLAEDVDPAKWIYANPSDTCDSIITGWDLGDVNHAVVMMEKQPDLRTFKSYFTVLDEVEHVKEEVSVEQVTNEVMEKILAFEMLYGKTFDLTYAWSDESSLTKYIAAADTFQHLQVMAYSGGRIELQGVEKAKYSVSARVQLLKKLLSENRLHVSAHCKAVIRMLKEIKKGKDDVVDPADPLKHIFDALTYPLLKECAEELHSLAIGNNVGKRKPVEMISL